jgi:cysteine dioxygenase
MAKSLAAGVPIPAPFDKLSFVSTLAAGTPASPLSPVGVEPPARRFPALAPLIAYLDGLRGRADLRVLERLLGELRIARADVEAACVFGTRGYKRNTISRTEHYELLALCWRSGHCTPIHDHEGVSCAFRVVAGTPVEIRFTKTPSGLLRPAACVDMPPGYVCAAEDADIHQVANMAPEGHDAVTLHIYSPPIARMNTYKAAGPCETLSVYGHWDDQVCI